MQYNLDIKRAQLKFEIGEYNNMIVENKKIKTKKAFTNDRSNNIMEKDYNPSKVNSKLIYESEGVFVKNKIEELSVKYKSGKKYIRLLKKICYDLGIKDYDNQIENFIKNKQYLLSRYIRCLQMEKHKKEHNKSLW